MTDSPDRPWTPLDVHLESDSHDDMHRYLAATRSQRIARRKLDALAPELAGAVLAHDECDRGGDCDCMDVFAVLAERLRMIGAKDE